MTVRISLCLAILGLALFTLQAGCGPAAKPSPAKNAAQNHDHEHDHEHEHDGHDHAAKGPNGGKILELGEEEYHVEWVNDDKADKVMFVVLDSNMKKEVPIEQSDVTVAVTIDGKSKEYKVPAANRTSGEKPVASRFEVIDKSLLTDLSIGEGVAAQLSLTVGGKPYTVKLDATADEHEHEHEHKH